jgi:hypothetical protein
MPHIRTALIAFGLALPLGMASPLHAHPQDQCHEEAHEVRRDVLGALKNRQILEAREDGREEQSGLAARDRLRGQVASREQDRTISRLESENERMRKLLVALGVDPDRMLRMTEER